MTRPSRRRRSYRPAALLFAALVVVGAVALARAPLGELLFDLTGEERLFAQVKGLGDLGADLLRPRLDLAPDAPVAHTNVSPFGINVFLNEEVEPAKRELTVRLAKEAGFHFLRQEFPWQDIEIHAKGDFEDRRNPPARSAWDKYDQIVALAEQYGLELIVRISTPPSWSRARGDEVGTFAPPDDYDDFGDFVHALVNRYRGRIRYYQIWNEPNIYPEWGIYPISPEDYTRLLKVGATRAREADPDAVIIAGALASTIALQPAAPPPNNALNDLLFLQRMYDAGAAPYFDIMAMQAYGLWSGPTDRRMHPRVMNYGRPQFVRDVMAANDDANKPIWISEMGWNAVPDSVPDKRFGQVTQEQQALYAPLAYQRAIEEWPWVGVVNTWYFKRATDEWSAAGRPEAYFRLADPDFTLKPVYHSLKSYMGSVEPALYPGTHEPSGWAVEATGTWQVVAAPEAPFGRVWEASVPGASLSFTFHGTGLELDAACDAARCTGTWRISVDGTAPASLAIVGSPAGGVSTIHAARNLSYGPHSAVIEAVEAPAGIRAVYIVRRRFDWVVWSAAGLAGALLLTALGRSVRRVVRARRREIEVR